MEIQISRIFKFSVLKLSFAIYKRLKVDFYGNKKAPYLAIRGCTHILMIAYISNFVVLLFGSEVTIPFVKTLTK